MQPASSGSDKIWRVIDFIHWGDDYFSEKGFESPRREIEWLLQSLLNCKRVDLYLRFEEPIEKSKLETLRGWIMRRTKREPLQYITGSMEFYGLPFVVNPSVLIPRAESERLIDVGLELLKENDNGKILDIGTGSGCLAATVAHHCPTMDVTAIDISEEAVALAQQNAENLSLSNVNFITMDILSEMPNERYDMVISNPPYIPKDEMPELMKDVLDYEPIQALTDDKDGLVFYRRIAEIGHKIVKQGGWILLEVGLGSHPEAALNLFKNSPYSNVSLILDYNGDPRVLKANVS